MGQADFDLVFIDPPYGKKLALQVLKKLCPSSFLAQKAIIIVEDQAQEEYPELIEAWTLFDKRQYGEAGFWLYRREEGVD